MLFSIFSVLFSRDKEWSEKAWTKLGETFNETYFTAELLDDEKPNPFFVWKGAHKVSLNENCPFEYKCDHCKGKKKPTPCPEPHLFQCQDCDALLLPGETTTMCCANGKIVCNGQDWQMKTPTPIDDPDIQELFLRQTPESKDFMKSIRLYNNLLAPASIKYQGGEVLQKGWNPNLRVHGEIAELLGP